MSETLEQAIHSKNKISNGRQMKILALKSGEFFAKKICNHLNYSLGISSGNTKLLQFTQLVKNQQNMEAEKALNDEAGEKFRLCPMEEITFANGEVKCVIQESVRGCDVYVVQLIDDPCSKKSINDNLMALAAGVNAAYQSDAYRVTAVIPQFPYARQDKKKGREPISAKIAGRLIEISGAKHAITLDVHSEAIEGFFEKLKLQNLHMGRILLEYIKKNIPQNELMVVAPDVGSAKRGVFFAKNLGVDLAIIDKVRDYSKISEVSTMRLVGEVKGKDVLVCDDMLATGGTILNAAKVLKQNGAREVYVAVALPFFSGRAVKQFREAYKEGCFKKVIGTNAVGWGTTLDSDEWYEELDVSALFAEVIRRLHTGDSVSALLA